MKSFFKKKKVLLSSFNMYKGGSLTIYKNIEKLIDEDINIIDISFLEKNNLKINSKRKKIIFPIKYFNFIYRFFIEQFLLVVIGIYKGADKIILLGNFSILLWFGKQTVFFHNLLYIETLINPKKYGLKLRLEAFIWKLFLLVKKPKIFVQSKYIKVRLEDYFGDIFNIKIIGIPLVQSDYKNHDDKITQKVDLRKINFLYPAFNYKHKNHNFLISKSNFFIEKNIMIHLTLKRNKNNLIRYNPKCFMLHGTLNAKEIDSLYKICDSLIFPSLVESLGIPLLETTLYKKPIIAVDLVYVQAVIKNAYLFDLKSEESFRNIINSFLIDKEKGIVKSAVSKVNIDPREFFENLIK